MDTPDRQLTTVLERATSRRDELNARIDILKNQLGALSEELHDVEAFLRLLPLFTQNEREVGPKVEDPLGSSRSLQQFVEKARAFTARLPKAQTVTDEAFKVLLRAGRPLHTRDLLAVLKELGFGGLIAGEDDAARAGRLSTMLSEDGRFDASRAVGWSIVHGIPQQIPPRRVVPRRVIRRSVDEPATPGKEEQE